jgi:hypothetical protein
MALSGEDWNRLERMRKDEREHLDDVTERLSSDSVRNWQAIMKVDKELEVHKAESAGVHQQPCPTAAAFMKDHVDGSLAHNPKKAIPVVASLLGLASTVGAWLSKILHFKTEIKP